MLELAFLIGLACFALVSHVREIPWVRARLERRPWGCNLCMSSWSVAVATAAVMIFTPGPDLWFPALLRAGGAWATCFFLLCIAEILPPRPPNLPNLPNKGMFDGV
jgi:hypothetical protein